MTILDLLLFYIAPLLFFLALEIPQLLCFYTKAWYKKFKYGTTFEEARKERAWQRYNKR